MQLVVEKIDLKSLFADVCAEFRIPIINSKGWSDINSRAGMMRRFRDAEARGQIGVLLTCGDLDPKGVQITDFLKSNMEDLADAVGWSPCDLIIDRFGLNADFIERHGLTWIEGLHTGTGANLADQTHRDHRQAYVQGYLAKHGARKCEANALVVNPQAGRDLMRATILKYLSPNAPDRYQERLQERREALRVEILQRLRELAADDVGDDDGR